MVKNKDNERLDMLINMISKIGAFDFSKRLETECTENPLDVVALGLNILSEEMEIRAVQQSKLEDKNGQLEAALHEVNNYKFALDKSAIIVITNIKGEIEYVNDMFCTISKYGKEELLGKNHQIINSDYHSIEFWKEMWDTINKGKIWRSETKEMKRDGNYYWVDTTIVPFMGNNDKPERFISIRYDITDKKLKEQELAKSQQLLKQVNQDLERFAYNVAHDMKSPLNSATGLISLLETELAKTGDKNMVQYLELLKDTNERTKRLIDGILDYSRTSLSGIELEYVYLGNLCNEAAAQYKTNEKVVINIDNNLPIVTHNETALTQIINNLLSNAIKHNNKQICEITIRCVEKPSHYEITVEDNGPGIKEEAHEIIFDLFENLKTRKENSTGIGLATVKKIVTETNGKIWVESQENKGAKFVWTIEKLNNLLLNQATLHKINLNEVNLN